MRATASKSGWRRKKDRIIIQYTINSFGTVSDMRFDRTGGVPDAAWNASWRNASRLDKTRHVWIMEFAIPLKDLGITDTPDGKTFSLLVSRNWKRP